MNIEFIKYECEKKYCGKPLGFKVFQLWGKYSYPGSRHKEFSALMEHINSYALGGVWIDAAFSDENDSIRIWEFSSKDQLNVCLSASIFKQAGIILPSDFSDESGKIKFMENFSF